MKLRRFIACLVAAVMCFGLVGINGMKAIADSKTTYWIKVNKQANVVTVYKKDGKDWEPVKAMVCSCGGGATPSGTFYLKDKWRWHELQGPSYGQYCIWITGNYLFHSVWYYDKDRTTQSVEQFNKLGTTASHGCVRLSTADEKWLYDNCKYGTKVTIYSSSYPGPLGKPAAYKMPASAGDENWDPTDASKDNPYYQSLPMLSKKVTYIQYDSSYYKTAKSLVNATQKNGKAVKSLKVNSVTKWSSSKGKYVSATFSNKSVGTYKIKYTLTGSKGVSITKTYKFHVRDTRVPTVLVYKTATRSRTVAPDTVNATQWLYSAKMASGTSVRYKSKVTVTAPNGVKKTMSYDKAKSFVFSRLGKYTVTYTAANKNNSERTASKSVTVTVSNKPIINAPLGKSVGLEFGSQTDPMCFAAATDCYGNQLPEGSVSYIVYRDEAETVFDTSVPGIYKIVYTAADSAKGTKTTMTVTVTVAEEPIIPEEPVTPEEPVIPEEPDIIEV